jgi:lipopolysaccharide export LptBFGC system permease protein LptF
MARRESHDLETTVVTFLVYYATFVPQLIFQYMLPVSMLLAASITATSSFSGPRGNNEYTVIRSAGVPVLRAFFPLLFPALVVAAGFQASRDHFLPDMVRDATGILNRLRLRTANPTSVSLVGPDGFQTAAIGLFSQDAVAHNIILEIRDQDKFRRGDPREGDNDFVAYRAAAAKLEPDAEGNYRWVPLEKGEVHIYSRFTRNAKPWTEPIPTPMTPAMIERQTLGDAVSTWRDLLILRDDNAGARFEMHWRLADPLACCLLIVWGTGICMGRMLRGRGANYIQSITISMLAAGVFYIFRLAGKTLWESGMLTAEEGIWYPLAAAAVIALPIALWMER